MVKILTLVYLVSLYCSCAQIYNGDSEMNQTSPETEFREDTETGVQKDECFGDRTKALELGRQCSRRCRKDIPCENTRKQCLCDGLCGMSCIKPDLNCPDLAAIENGIISEKNNRFNSRVTYLCNEGYYLFGSRERLCQGDEDWSGTPAVCMSERKSSYSLFMIPDG